ncbi:MAG: succinylglutamate desuccinylase/aspartoacylase family protein [Polyangiaceae bacterium]|nr:succinylglutamate desuccinylase/aspartoacylase family protein [Polyangiaceae bacterium]
MTPRQINRLASSTPGPTLIIVGGLHGNEPAGMEAARIVLSRLRHDKTPHVGEVVALAGNLRALVARRRYLDRDLNRQWTEERVAEARQAVAAATDDPAEAELHETVELADAIETIMARARGPVFVLDLHTTSSEGTPFGVVGPTPEHRAFAAHFALPCMVGLETQLPGVLTSYLGRRGCVTFAVEGGQHDSAKARDHLVAAVTVALVASGVFQKHALPDYDAQSLVLEHARGSLPKLIEVLSRHAIAPDHDFEMAPGFSTIHPTPAGTLIARDRSGEIRASNDCLVLLPLYQAQGADGFFVGRALD